MSNLIKKWPNAYILLLKNELSEAPETFFFNTPRVEEEISISEKENINIWEYIS